MNITIDALFVVVVALIAVVVVLHVYVRSRRIKSETDCAKRIDELSEHIRRVESLNAKMVLKVMTMAETVGRASPSAAQEMKELVESLFALFREYQSGGVNIDAEGNVTISGDVVGKSKKVQA